MPISASFGGQLSGISDTIKISASDGTLAIYFSPSEPTISNVTRVKNLIDGTLTTVSRVDRVMNIVDGTIGVENVTRVRNVVDGTLSTVYRVANIVDGTLSTVQRIQNIIDGTLTTVTGIDRIKNVVDGTLSTVYRVANVVDGTLTTVTGLDRVRNVVDGTLTTITRVDRVMNVINGTITVNAGTGTMTVAFDPGHELGTIRGNTSTLTVFLPDTGHELGTIRGNTNTLTVFLPDTGHTIGKVDAGLGTFNVKLDPGYTLGKVDAGIGMFNTGSTAQIFTASGSTSGVSTSGVTIIAPSAAYNFKIFAYSIQTTGIVSLLTRFTNGAGVGPTEFWRPLVTSVQTSSTPIGANLVASPPSFIFATGVNTTLALLLDTATLVHYSVSFIKESS